MKTTELKKLIKEAVKEVFQDELKDILLEALKSPKQVIKETQFSPLPPNPFPQPGTPAPITMDRKQSYMDILGETALNFTSKDVAKFNPGTNVDVINGSLPEGDVGVDQIMSLMSNAHR